MALPWHVICCVLVLILVDLDSAIADIRFTPRISSGFAYTDNVFLTPVDEQYDYITFVTPGFDLEATGRHSGLTINYDPSYISFTRFPEKTYWRHDAKLDGWAEIVKDTRLELKHAYLRTAETQTETDTTVRQGREPYSTNRTTMGIVNRFGVDDSIDLRYEYYQLDNEDVTIEDKSYHRPSLLFTYWLSPNRYAMEMEGQYTISEFDVSEDFEDLDARFRFSKRFGRHVDAYFEYTHVFFDYLDDGEDYRVYSPLVGFTFFERADTDFGASFGYFYRDNQISEDDDGIVGSIDMRHDYATNSNFSIKGQVGYDRAYFGAENLGFNPFYEVKGDITHQLSRRISGGLTAGYRRNLYIDEEPDREDALWTAGGGLAYQVAAWLRFDLVYRYRQVNSNVDTNDYTENMGLLSVTLTPRRELRL